MTFWTTTFKNDFLREFGFPEEHFMLDKEDDTGFAWPGNVGKYDTEEAVFYLYDGTLTREAQEQLVEELKPISDLWFRQEQHYSGK